MPTLTRRGSGTPATTGTVWTTVTNAVDGTPPANPATYAVWTSSTSGAIAELTVTNYDFSPIPAGSTINSVTVTLRHFENNITRIASVFFQPQTAAGGSLGTAFTATRSLTVRDDTQTYSITLANLQAAGFKIRATATRAAVTQSATFNVDHIDVTVDYTAPSSPQTWTGSTAGIGAAGTSGAFTAPPPGQVWGGGAGPSWTQDYTATAVGFVPGWTSRGGFRLGVADFSGTTKGVVVEPSSGDYIDWYFTSSSYDTALATGQAQTMRVRVEFETADSGVSLYLRGASNLASYNGVQLQGNGNWVAVNETGGSGYSGTFTVPAFNTPFEVELRVAADSSAEATIDGTVYALADAGVFNRSGLYGGMLITNRAKVHRWYYGDPQAPGGGDDVAGIGVAGTSGTFTSVAPPQTWTGSTATAGAAGVSAAFTGGAVTWAGGSTGTMGVAGISGTFTGGATSWTGSTGTVGAAGTSGDFVAGAAPPQTWTGSTATVGAAGESGAFTAGTATWTGSTATAGVAATSGTFTGGATTWTGSTATAGAAGVSGSFGAGFAPQTWAGSAGQAGTAATSGVFTGGAVTWDGSTAAAGAAGVSGAFSAGAAPQTWVGSSATAGAAATSGTFVAGGQAWTGSSATAGVAAVSGVWAPGGVVWVGSPGGIGVAGIPGAFIGAAQIWVASVARVGVAGVSGPFVSGTATIVGQWNGHATIGMQWGTAPVMEWILTPP